MSHWQKHFQYYDKFQTCNPKYLKMLGFLVDSVKNTKYILDSGAGTGNLTKLLLDRGHAVVALDNNKFALNILKNKCASNKLNIVKSDLNKTLPFDDENFDSVVSSFVLPYIKDFANYFKEHYRTLKFKGIFATSILLPESGIMNYILDSIKYNEIEKKLISQHYDWWQEIEKSSRKNEDKILRNGKSKSEILEFLQNAGFKDIVEMKSNPYGKFVLILKCKK